MAPPVAASCWLWSSWPSPFSQCGIEMESPWGGGPVLNLGDNMQKAWPPENTQSKLQNHAQAFRVTVPSSIGLQPFRSSAFAHRGLLFFGDIAKAWATAESLVNTGFCMCWFTGPHQGFFTYQLACSPVHYRTFDWANLSPSPICRCGGGFLHFIFLCICGLSYWGLSQKFLCHDST